MVQERVRPAELQIICTALKGVFTSKRYKLLGGYGGILSDFIQGAIARCADRDLARLVVRSLCDFENEAPRLPLRTARICDQIEESKAKPGIAAKAHKATKPTRAQDLRRAWQLNEDLADGIAG